MTGRAEVPDDTPAGRTILITGGAGFIGSHLADALVEDNDVRVVDDLSAGRRERVPDGATFLRGDVRDEETVRAAMADVEVVFHQAAVVSVDRSVRDPRRSHGINADGTLAVLERARREDARVIVTSSAAIYGHPRMPRRPLRSFGAAPRGTRPGRSSSERRYRE